MSFSSKFHSNRCTISDGWSYNNMQVVYMENDLLRIGVLVGRGADIFEFYYKPAALDFMCRLDRDIRNPREEFPQIRDTANQLEDYYYGGWQEALPNSLSHNYRGAQLGQHGEVWMLPWKHAVLLDSAEEVVLKVWCRPLRVPLQVKRTISLKLGDPTLYVEETLTNLSNSDLDLMWGHHIAFGLPFLKEGGFLETSAGSFQAEPSMPPHRRFLPGIIQYWPMVKGVDGSIDDARNIPHHRSTPYSDLAYLSSFDGQAYYTLFDQHRSLGFRVDWDPHVFKYLWFWQERYATRDAPWWGSAYVIGLEPWTGPHPADPQQSIKQGDYLHLTGGTSLQTWLKASIVDQQNIPDHD